MSENLQPILLDSTGKEIAQMLRQINRTLQGDTPVEQPATLNEASWNYIQSCIANGTFLDYFSVGDIKGVEVNMYGAKRVIPAMVVGVNKYADHTVDFIFLSTFEMTDPTCVQHHNGSSSASSRYVSAPANQSAYTYRTKYFFDNIACPNHASNPMAITANTEVFNVLCDDLKEIIVPKTTKYFGITIDSSDIMTVAGIECSNKIWMPTYYELTGNSWLDGDYSDTVSSKYQRSYNIENVNSVLPFSDSWVCMTQYISINANMVNEGDTMQFVGDNIPIGVLKAGSSTFSVWPNLISKIDQLSPIVYGFTVGVPNE